MGTRLVVAVGLIGCGPQASAPVAPVVPPCERPFTIRFPSDVTPTEGAENGSRLSLASGTTGAIAIAYRKPSLVMVLIVADRDASGAATEPDRLLGSLRLVPDCHR